MLFNSYTYISFFVLVILILLIMPRRYRYIWLIISSFCFYMCWNVKYIILVSVTAFSTWLSALLISKYKNIKWVFITTICVNLLILGVLKYTNFFIENLSKIFNKFNIPFYIKDFDIVFTIGISFYTFQALGYLIDVYRQKINPEKNLLKYTLFVSFFPTINAGPIERADNLLAQIRLYDKKHLWNYKNITNGATLMLWGYFQKLVIADRISILVNTVYGQYWSYGSIGLMLAAVGYSIQIYCDFSSYSLIAIGSAKIMGFELKENFDAPYLSKSIQEFWRKWHITLSTWFRDYVYIPLGGNRCSKGRMYFNLMCTFLLSGLWHGANWTYIIWGGYMEYIRL